MGKKQSLLIPTDKEFLSNKDISDRLYVWILMNGNKDGYDIYIDKVPRNGYKKLNTSYPTFKKRMIALESGGYLKNCGYQYRVSTDNVVYKRLVYKSTIQKLFDTGIDHIIKVYVYLASLYTQYGTKSYFTLSNLLETIGYSYSRNVKMNNKMKEILSKLVELGLIEYYKDTECGERYNTRYKLVKVEKGVKK